MCGELENAETPLTSSSDYVIGPQGILSSKCRVLVTNSIAFLKQFDELAFMRRGIILETGNYEELISNESSEVHKLMYVSTIPS